MWIVSPILTRSLERSRLSKRWVKVHACLIAPASDLTSERVEKIKRVCNRLADRMDEVNPWLPVAKSIRL